jgi:ethanolamine utilization protein EutN
MEVGRVIGNVICTVRHESYDEKRILMVQELDLDGRPRERVRVAVDYVGAGVGDLVLVGGAPGVAANVFGLEKAPIRDLVMAIVDRVDVYGERTVTLYDDTTHDREED